MGVVLNLDLDDKRIFIIPTKNVLFPKVQNNNFSSMDKAITEAG